MNALSDGCHALAKASVNTSFSFFTTSRNRPGFETRGLPDCASTIRLVPPGRRSNSTLDVDHGAGANHCFTSSGSVQAAIHLGARHIEDARQDQLALFDRRRGGGGKLGHVILHCGQIPIVLAQERTAAGIRHLSMKYLCARAGSAARLALRADPYLHAGVPKSRNFCN